MQDDLGATSYNLAIVRDHSESATGVGFPALLVIEVVFRDNNDLLGNKVI